VSIAYNGSVLLQVGNSMFRLPELLMIAAQKPMFIPSAPLAQNPM
jgi:hypothetical protein